MKKREMLICAGILGAALIMGGALVSSGQEEPAEQLEEKKIILEDEPELLVAPDAYIFEDSDIRELTEEEILALPEEERRMAAFEICARRGRSFIDTARRDYFREKGWYRARIDGPHFEMDFLNRYEEENLELLWKYIDFMLPGSDVRNLSEEEIRDLTEEEIIIAENEILARHGFIFDDPAYQAYFEEKSWYEGTAAEEEFDDTVLNEYENKNLADLSMAKLNIKRERTAHDGIMIK